MDRKHLTSSLIADVKQTRFKELLINNVEEFENHLQNFKTTTG
jgi:hypothetical protein